VPPALPPTDPGWMRAGGRCACADDWRACTDDRYARTGGGYLRTGDWRACTDDPYARTQARCMRTACGCARSRPARRPTRRAWKASPAAGGRAWQALARDALRDGEAVCMV